MIGALYACTGLVIAEWFSRTHKSHPYHWVGVSIVGLLWPIMVFLLLIGVEFKFHVETDEDDA